MTFHVFLLAVMLCSLVTVSWAQDELCKLTVADGDICTNGLVAGVNLRSIENRMDETIEKVGSFHRMVEFKQPEGALYHWRFKNTLQDKKQNLTLTNEIGAMTFEVVPFFSSLAHVVQLDQGCLEHGETVPADLILVGEMSVEMWVKIPYRYGTVGYTLVYLGGVGGDSNDNLNVLIRMIVLPSGQLVMYHETTGGSDRSFASTYPCILANQFHHIVATRSATGLYIMYVDGVEVGRGQLDLPTDGSTAHLALGGRASVDTTSRFSDMAFATFSFYNTVLTPTTIQANYLEPLTTLDLFSRTSTTQQLLLRTMSTIGGRGVVLNSRDPDLMLKYQVMDDQPLYFGVHDHAGVFNNHVYAASGASPPITASPFTEGAYAVNFDGAYELEAGESYGEMDETMFDGDFTWTVWLKQRNYATTQTVLGMVGIPGDNLSPNPDGSDRENCKFRFSFVITTGMFQLYYETGDGTTQEVIEATKVKSPLNKWMHLTVVYENANGKLKLYTNGEYVETLTLMYTDTRGGQNGHLTIGHYNQLFHFDGQIDLVQMYKRAFTSLEVMQHFKEDGGTADISA